MSVTTRNKFNIPIKHEDWLERALPQVIAQLQLIRDGKWPTVLRGWSIIIIALRLLRCIWGSDIATLHGIQQHVISDMEFSAKCTEHFARYPDGCGNMDCELCVDIRDTAKS